MIYLNCLNAAKYAGVDKFVGRKKILAIEKSIYKYEINSTSIEDYRHHVEQIINDMRNRLERREFIDDDEKNQFIETCDSDIDLFMMRKENLSTDTPFTIVTLNRVCSFHNSVKHRVNDAITLYASRSLSKFYHVKRKSKLRRRIFYHDYIVMQMIMYVHRLSHLRYIEEYNGRAFEQMLPFNAKFTSLFIKKNFNN